MKQKIANYTVLIERQKRMGTNKMCYMVYAPILEIATDADFIEEAEKEIKSLIEFHIESLAREGEEIPIETGEAFVTRSQVNLPASALFM